jgi:hypothetical protein
MPNILAKLGVTSRGEATAAAHRLRQLDPAPEPPQQLVVTLGRERQIGAKPLPAGEQTWMICVRPPTQPALLSAAHTRRSEQMSGATTSESDHCL